MKDIEIANKSKMLKIIDIASNIGLTENDIECYGDYKAKIISKNIENKNKAKLILVTAINPTPYGEGKTTVSIGLGDALNALGKKTLITLREPSLGPVFGIKGGATGGGYSQVIPMIDINLHFTGDFHAITSANNLLSAVIDNHLKQGNELNIDSKKITFNRCLDVNDRALRNIKINLGGKINGIPRNEKFNITAASEIMSILCLATNLKDLETRLGNILIGYNKKDKPIFCRDLNAQGAMSVLLKDAINPNLVQTLENNPVIIHGGPFANIAHGCNSLIATNLSLKLADYVVTEAGFGADLGALKFMDIKCRYNNIKPDCVVLVATIKALKYNGGILKESILKQNLKALENGIVNLEAHLTNLKKYGVNVLVCLNKYDTDTQEEIIFLKNYCENNNIKFSISEAYLKGGNGALDLAHKVIEITNIESQLIQQYELSEPLKTKIKKICTNIYNAKDVRYSKQSLKMINILEKNNLDKLPICIAKTQYSISGDPKKLGNPQGYIMNVKDIRLYNGAGFITVLVGNIMTMPGLSKNPAYQKVRIVNDIIEGIF